MKKVWKTYRVLLVYIYIYIKRAYCNVAIAVAADNRAKINENGKRDKFLDFVKELIKLWNMRMKVTPTVISALGTIPKRFERRLEEFEIGRRIVTLQTTTLLRSARVLRRVLETRGKLLPLRLQ